MNIKIMSHQQDFKKMETGYILGVKYFNNLNLKDGSTKIWDLRASGYQRNYQSKEAINTL